MKINIKKSDQNPAPAAELKKPWGNRRRMKHGSYSLALSAVVIAGAVLLNLIVNELPSQYTKIDLSSNQLSVLSDQTKELLSSLTEDITIYYLAQDSNQDETVARLLERYADLSGHVKVVQKDPVLYPKFASQYTDSTLTENSVIVTCGESSRVIAYEDMYQSDFDYNYYSYQTTGFDAEGQITSAISALTSDNLPKLYTLSGHGEVTLSDSLAASVEKENIETETLNLVSADSVPEDADALLIAAPTRDISDSEARKILNYLKRGGQAILFIDYTGTDMPNLTSILDYYGVSLAEGVVMENNSNYYVQMPYYLLPVINSTDVSSDMADGNTYVILAAAQGIQKAEDVRDSVTITDVLTTSSSAFSKTDVENMTTYEKEDGDIDGPFPLGVLITEDVELTDELLAETSAVSETGGLAELELSGSTDSQDDDTPDAETSSQEGSDADTGSASDEAADGSDSSAVQDDTEDSDPDTAEASTEGSGTDAAESETDSGTESGDEEVETATTKLAVFTSSALLDSSVDQMVSGGNSRLVMNTLSWVCGSTASVSVPVKSMTTEYLTVPAASGSFWSIIVIGLIPGVFLVYGLYIWLRRRKQ